MRPCRKLIAGIVLTGGGALLSHIEKLSEYHTGLPTRIGIPIEPLAHGYAENLSSPIYATAIGLLMKGIEDREKGRIVLPTTLLEEIPAAKEKISTPKLVTLDAQKSLTISWCKKRKRAGEVQMCDPSRFIAELPTADVKHFGNPFNDPDVSREFGKSKMAGIRAMLNKSG